MCTLRLQLVITHMLHLKGVFKFIFRLVGHIIRSTSVIVTCESLWAHMLHLKGVMECTSLGVNV